MNFIKNYQKRNINIELLRIICMIMVVVGHGIISSRYMESKDLCKNNVSWGIMAYVSVAVNCYFLITGYFGEKQKFRISKIFSLWGETIFYSIVIALIFSVLNDQYSLTSTYLLIYSFPVFFKNYWFIQAYIVLLLIRPFLNIVLYKINRIQFQYLLFVGLIFFSLHETFIPVSHTLDNSQGYGIIWAIYMYFVGAYIQRYLQSLRLPKKKLFYAMLYISVCMAIYFSGYLIVKLGIAGGEKSRGNFYAYNSISMFIASLSLFIFFTKINTHFVTKIQNIILFFSKTAISVYLISAHPLLFTSFWLFCFNYLHFDNFIYNVVAIFILSFFVYIVCSIIDFIRYKVFDGFSNSLYSKLCCKVDKIFNF